jgi:hypothetical protein
VTGEELGRCVSRALPELARVDTAALARSLAERRAAEQRLRAADDEGRWWPPGTLAGCQALLAGDLRYAFIERLGRSWAFGELIAGALEEELTGGVTPEALELAGLINVFVTCFDGICDDVPELLPRVLPALGEMVAAFPRAGSSVPSGDNPVVRLAWAAVMGSAKRLAAGLSEAPGEVRQAMGEAVRDAYGAQVEALAPVRDSSPAGRELLVARRSAVSAGPMRIAVLIPVVFHPEVARDLDALDALARELGRHFGWVDDIVDLELDLRYGQPNAVAALAGLERPGDLTALDPSSNLVAEVLRESRRRWAALEAASARAGLDGERPRDGLALATVSWLGATSVPAGR